MGRAARWFRALLGMKGEKENVENSDSGERREKKRWSFGKSGRGSSVVGKIPLDIPLTDADWLRCYVSETEAVAAATAAAADAVVAAAQAAVAVARLTSQGRGALFCGGREKWAAVKIQTVFRGCLARKALRALKGLVKLQALVRGYLVRKRATATLHSMQALIRAQAAVRSQRARRSINRENRFQSELRARRSMERFDETRSESHSKRLSASIENSQNLLEESPKIVKIDAYKPRPRSKRINPSISDSSEDPYNQTPSSEWNFTGDECKFATAQSTPRFENSNRSNGPPTPAKSVCGDSIFRPYANFPNYMSNTQSFRAKLRSFSAPKQRPQPGSKKRLSLDEVIASRISFSGVRMQRSCSQIQEGFDFSEVCD